MTTRKKPQVDVGNITKQRDRQFFQDFVLEVIEDTFIYEFIPTSISLSGEFFTLTLGPVDNNSDGDYSDLNDIRGYRFAYEDLVVDTAIDYLDVYLYGVKQEKNRYRVELYNSSNEKLNTSEFASSCVTIKIIFEQAITRVPAEVVRTDFEIKGKITEIE